MANGNGYNPQVAPTVLGSGTKPLDYLLQRRQREGIEAQRKQALAQQQQAARDKQLGKLMEFQPDKAWEPYDQALKNQVNEYRNWVVSSLKANPNASNDPAFLAKKKRKEDKINNTASQSQHVKGLHKQQYDAINDNQYLKKGYYQNKLNNMVYGEGGQLGRNFDDIDFNALRNITSDAKGYNMDAIGKDFVDALPDSIQEYYTERQDSLGGKYYNITEKKGKAIRNAEVNPETGTYDINVTDDVVLMAKQHPYLGNALEQYKQDTGETDDKKALSQILDKYVPQTTRTDTPGRRITPSAHVVKARQVAADADKRYEFVHSGLWEGDATKIKAASDLTEGVDVQFSYPDGPAAKGEKLKPDKLIITWNQFNIQGIPIAKTEEIDISTDEKLYEAEDILNTLLNEKEVSGKKVGVDAWDAAREKFRKKGGKAGGIYPTGKTTGAGGIF